MVNKTVQASQNFGNNSVINIANLDELVSQTPQIVERINSAPNGGRLFLADPIRLLAELNVVLTPEATRALQEALGAQDLANNPVRHLYDDFKSDQPDAESPIIIRGIVPPSKNPATAPDNPPNNLEPAGGAANAR